MIIGRSLDQTFPPRPPASARHGREVLRLEGLSTAGKLRDASLRRCAPAKSLGVAGLQGMGQLDLFLACFGMIATKTGTVYVDGKPVVIASPVDAVRANIGISLVPEDRKTEALFLKLSGKAQCFHAGDRSLLPLRADRRRARERGRRVGVSPHGRRPIAPCGRGWRHSPAATSRRSPSPNGCWRKAASCCSTIRPAASMSAPSMSSIS